jgi:hypothetical protein
MLTSEEVREIAARVELVSTAPPPWRVCEKEQVVRAADDGIVFDASCDTWQEWAEDKHLAEFIAHSRADITDLLSDRAEMQAEIERLRAALKKAETGGYTITVRPACPVCHYEKAHAGYCVLGKALEARE